MSKELKEGEIFMAPPDSCMACGWKPVIPNNENQKISVENAWLLMPMPNSPVWFYICPKCNMVTANKNCIENMEKFQKLMEKRIVQAKSPIILPNRGALKGRS